MIDSLNQYIAYICPDCSAITGKQVNIFDFSGRKQYELLCGSKRCKGRIGTISEYRGKYRVSLYCDFCGEIHEFIVSKSTFWNKELFRYGCPNTSFDLFFVGHCDEVKAAVKEQEEIISSLGDENADDGDLMLLDILEKLKYLTENDSIFCSCGNRIILPLPAEDGVVLLCGKCGAERFIPFDDEGYDTIMNADFLEIKK